MTHADTLDASVHLDNVAENLQLVADLGYGDVALATLNHAGELVVRADARPMTALAAVVGTRVGEVLPPNDEPEAYAALATGESVMGEQRRITRGISYATAAYPIRSGREPHAVIVRDLAQQVLDAPGKMETVFMQLAEGVIAELASGPLLEVENGLPFHTVRIAGDGVMRIDTDGIVDYASPNAVNIMRLAGVEGGLTGSEANGLPGAVLGIMPVLGVGGAHAVEVEVADRVLCYRTIALADGALVLIEDITEARRREQQIKVKEATIREVHHRVKNNLQTIASLLRIQARRSESDETRRALGEAVDRVASMAIVHEMLASSTEERIDFTDAARTVVDMVHRGLSGDADGIEVLIEGSTGEVPAHIATSFALVIAELVHNAIEHGFPGDAVGTVTVTLRRLRDEIVIAVRDDGAGLPEGFDAESNANLGLAIVRTIVGDDLRGTLTLGGGRGTTVTVRVPLEAAESGKA